MAQGNAFSSLSASNLLEAADQATGNTDEQYAALPQELCLAVQAGAVGVSLEQALPALPGGSTCTSCGRPVQVCTRFRPFMMQACSRLASCQTPDAARICIFGWYAKSFVNPQGCAPRLCRACGAAAKAALKRSLAEGSDLPAPKRAKSSSKAAMPRASSGGGGGKGSKAGGGGGAAKARVHLAQPMRGVTAARAERSTHRHKKLFTSEPGALTVRGCTMFLLRHSSIVRACAKLYVCRWSLSDIWLRQQLPAGRRDVQFQIQL